MDPQMADLSLRQKTILQFLIEFMEDNQYPPSVREIQNGCDISSTSVVDYNLRHLEEKGFINRGKEISRSISLENNHFFTTITNYYTTPIYFNLFANIAIHIMHLCMNI